MDATGERQSEISSLKTRFSNQPIEFADYGVQEIDKRLRSSDVGSLLRTKTYGKMFLYMHAVPSVELVIMNEGTFLPYCSVVTKKLFKLNSRRQGYAARWSCGKKEFDLLSPRWSAFGSGAGSRSR